MLHCSKDLTDVIRLQSLTWGDNPKSSTWVLKIMGSFLLLVSGKCYHKNMNICNIAIFEKWRQKAIDDEYGRFLEGVNDKEMCYFLEDLERK
jgi:hypothetical protein